jgi:hypothetical protein
MSLLVEIRDAAVDFHSGGQDNLRSIGAYQPGHPNKKGEGD